MEKKKIEAELKEKRKIEREKKKKEEKAKLKAAEKARKAAEMEKTGMEWVELCVSGAYMKTA